MDHTSLNQTADLFKTLAHPVRLKVVLLTSQGTHHVGSIQDHLQLDQPTASHHLTKLRDKGILIGQRKDKEMHYQVNRPVLHGLAHWLTNIPHTEAETVEGLRAGQCPQLSFLIRSSINS